MKYQTQKKKWFTSVRRVNRKLKRQIFGTHIFRNKKGNWEVIRLKHRTRNRFNLFMCWHRKFVNYCICANIEEKWAQSNKLKSNHFRIIYLLHFFLPAHPVCGPYFTSNFEMSNFAKGRIKIEIESISFEILVESHDEVIVIWCECAQICHTWFHYYTKIINNKKIRIFTYFIYE